MVDIIEVNNDCATAFVEEEEQDYVYALQISESIAFPMVMHTILELDVLGIISRAGPGCELRASEIAANLPEVKNPTAATMLDRMLRLLAAYKVVTCSTVLEEEGVTRKYGLAPVAKYFVSDGESLAPMLSINQDNVLLDGWRKLKDAVLEGGIPFNMVHGMHAFEYQGVDTKFNEIFNKAMSGSTSILMKKILTKYNGFNNIESLVDVGGGLGDTLRFITSQYPNIKGINFDLPHVIEHALPCLGIEHVSGDMLEKVPKGDAIFMKWILHDWDDNSCIKLLKNCYNALPEDGKVIVVEVAIDDKLEINSVTRAISLLDVGMMTHNPGGKERTMREFEDLAKAAGFVSVNFDSYVLPFWVMEFIK